MNDLILYHLRVFHAVAKHLSYSKAGEELNLSQPAVSRQVASLEKGLGLDLFSKHGRSVVLTDAGRVLYDYADRIMALTHQANRALSQYHDLERGEVRLGANPMIASYILPTIIKEFYVRFPNIKVSLYLDNTTKLARLISEGELDIALAVGPVDNNNIHLERYVEDKLTLIYPANEQHDNINQLFDKYPLIIKEKHSMVRVTVEKQLTKIGVTPRFFMEISDTEVSKKLVMSGIGIAFLPVRAIQYEVESGQLKKLSREEITFTRWVYLLTSKDQHYCPTLLAFINFIRKYQ